MKGFIFFLALYLQSLTGLAKEMAISADAQGAYQAQLDLAFKAYQLSMEEKSKKEMAKKMVADLALKKFEKHLKKLEESIGQKAYAKFLVKFNTGLVKETSQCFNKKFMPLVDGYAKALIKGKFDKRLEFKLKAKAQAEVDLESFNEVKADISFSSKDGADIKKSILAQTNKLEGSLKIKLFDLCPINVSKAIRDIIEPIVTAQISSQAKGKFKGKVGGIIDRVVKDKEEDKSTDDIVNDVLSDMAQSDKEKPKKKFKDDSPFEDDRFAFLTYVYNTHTEKIEQTMPEKIVVEKSGRYQSFQLKLDLNPFLRDAGLKQGKVFVVKPEVLLAIIKKIIPNKEKLEKIEEEGSKEKVTANDEDSYDLYGLYLTPYQLGELEKNFTQADFLTTSAMISKSDPELKLKSKGINIDVIHLQTYLLKSKTGGLSAEIAYGYRFGEHEYGEQKVFGPLNYIKSSLELRQKFLEYFKIGAGLDAYFIGLNSESTFQGKKGGAKVELSGKIPVSNKLLVLFTAGGRAYTADVNMLGDPAINDTQRAFKISEKGTEGYLRIEGVWLTEEEAKKEKEKEKASDK